MGRMWGAANRAEGYKFGARDGGLVLIIDVVLWTCRGIFRYFSGRPMFGDRHRKTDATFLRAGTRQLHNNDRPPFLWSWLPEWKRAAIRIGMLIELVSIPWSFYGTGPYAVIAAIVAIVIAGNVIWALATAGGRKVHNWRNTREVVKPLQAGLSPILGIPPNDVVVRLPRKKRKGGRAS